MEKRSTNKYYFKVGNKRVKGGISDRDLVIREKELQNSGKVLKCGNKTYDYSDGHIEKVGRKTTRQAALEWERSNSFGANQQNDFCNL